MTIMSMLPGTADWLLARVSLAAQLKLRRELRRTQRGLDARFAGLFDVGGAALGPHQIRRRPRRNVTDRCQKR